MMSKFWWGHKENGNKIAWMSWVKMGKTKELGGMGFRDLEYFNMALLAKQGWRLFQHPDSLVAKIFKENYYPNCTFMDTSIGKKLSYAWRSIWNAKSLLQEGLVWRVGDGQSISIWKGRWIPTETTHAIQSLVRLLEGKAKVSELIDFDTNWWNIPLVEEIFLLEEAQITCGLTICPNL